MTVVSMNYLLEAGVQFGHQKRRWNPKMKEYIFTTRDDIYIIDLQKTVKKLEEAYDALKEIAANEGKVLFVGTKKQAQEAAEESAVRTNMYFVNERWLGGTLTNFKTIRSRIRRMEEIETMEKDGTFEVLPKKEVAQINKEKGKLEGFFNGIKDMIDLPAAMIVVDPKTEHNAVAEAHRLGIPVFGLVDTNCDPDDVDYVIPANDDGVRAVRLIIGVLANAVLEGKGQAVEPYVLPEEEKAPEAEQNNNRKNFKNQKPARQPRAPRQPKAPKEEVKVEEAAPAVENSEN